MDHDKLWKTLREMGIPDHLTCLLRTCMWVKKQQLEPCMEQMSTTGLSAVTFLLNLYAMQIMRNVRLDELQAGIRTGGRKVNNLRNADDTTLIAESEEELKSLLMRMKEKSKRACLKLSMKKN